MQVWKCLAKIFPRKIVFDRRKGNQKVVSLFFWFHPETKMSAAENQGWFQGLPIRRPESACSSNNLTQNPTLCAKSKIQTAAFGAATKRMETTTIQNPNSKIQAPKCKIQTTLDFGFGRPPWGGHVANALVWMGWPPKFGIVGRGPSLDAKGNYSMGSTS